MKLLEETIRELKGEDLEDDVRATVNLKVDLRIDEAYVPDMNQRLTHLPAGGRRAGARTRSTRIVDEMRGPVRPAADLGAEPGRLRPHPGAWPTGSASRPSTARARPSS